MVLILTITIQIMDLFQHEVHEQFHQDGVLFRDPHLT
jgi:hypothetical protein